MAISHPEGAGPREAMRRTLAVARVNATDIDCINAHATSPPAGDRSEPLALHAIFTAHSGWTCVPVFWEAPLRGR